MKNKKLKIGLGVAVVALVVGGCAAAKKPQPTAKYDITGKGDVFAVVLFNSEVSGDAVCKAAHESNPQFNDSRCEAPGKYYGVRATPQFGAWASDAFPVLIPSDVKVAGNFILRVHLQDGHPAYFQFVANPGKGDKNTDCYINGTFGPGTGGTGGVVCPKYNWDYRDYVPNP